MKKPIVTVIGSGYVGFPLAYKIAKSGLYKTNIYTIDPKAVKKINIFQPPISISNTNYDLKSVELFATSDPKRVLPKSDIIIICVPTTITSRKKPDWSSIVHVSNIISLHLRKGQLVILESTVAPGTCESLIIPILEKSGLKGGSDFYFSYCPERINPGDLKWNLGNIPRNVAGSNKRGLNKTLAFYRSFLKAPLNPMRSIDEVEMTKLIENSFRDLNIAFINEVAKLCDQLGINILNVISGAASKPFSFLPHYPGCGVGGDCIAVDPYYLIDKAQEVGMSMPILQSARKTNLLMPRYTVQQLLNVMKKHGLNLKTSVVGVLGLTYKPEVADLRQSPAELILKELKKRTLNIVTFDPYSPKQSTASTLEEVLKQSTALIIVTAHRLFLEKLTPKILIKNKIRVVIDGRNCLNAELLRKAGIVYKGIGI